MQTPVTVGQVLRAKGFNYWYIHPSASAYEALEILAEKNVGALPVIENRKLVGMFSERDYARKVILKGKSSKSTTVGELMTGDPITISPESTLRDCMLVMRKNHIRHLPVMEGDVMKGIVSINDVVDSIIAQQETTISDLQSYISVGY